MLRLRIAYRNLARFLVVGCLGRRAFHRLLRARGITFLRDFFQRGAHVACVLGVRELLQVSLERRFRRVRLFQIVLLDVGDGELRRAAIAASRILLDQEFVAVDGRLKIRGVELLAHFFVQFRLSHQRRRHFFRLRRDQVNLVVGRDGLLVIGERAVFRQVAFQLRAHRDGALELFTRCFRLVGARHRARHERPQRQRRRAYCHCANHFPLPRSLIREHHLPVRFHLLAYRRGLRVIPPFFRSV